MQVFYDMKGGSFCPDATKALFLICDCPYVKSYQIGDLLKLRADPNCRSFERANAPIHQLIQLRKTKAVKLLLDWGADLNCTNTAGRTPLMTACDSVECSKQLLIVNYLLQKEAINIDAWDEDGNSAATLAIRRSNIWTLRELLISGARVNVSRKRMPYFSMDDVNESEHEVALDLARSLLLNNECDRDRKSDRGNTGIQCANKIVFFLDSLRKSKREICFQMAKRKGTLERVGLNCGTDRFKTVQNIYRDELNSVRAKDTPASGRKSKLNAAHELPLQQMEPQGDNAEGEAMEIAQDVEVTREEDCFRK
jgi:Ankyrin repeats (3 copies)